MSLLTVLTGRTQADANIFLAGIADLSHFIRHFGSPYLPRVPTVFQRYEALSDMALDSQDRRTPEHWAQDLFARVCAESHMESVVSTALSTMHAEALRYAALNMSWHTEAPGAYACDVAGRAVCTFDPSKASQPSEIARDFILQLAMLRLICAPAPQDYTATDHGRLVMTGAVFNGQGLELLNTPRRTARHPLISLRDHEAKHRLEHLIVLCMVVRRLVPEQIIASYGPILRPGFRKRIWTLTRALDEFAPEVKLLRRLCDGTECPESAQILLRSQLLG